MNEQQKSELREILQVLDGIPLRRKIIIDQLRQDTSVVEHLKIKINRLLDDSRKESEKYD